MIHVQNEIQERIRTSTAPAIMPVTALPVLRAITTVTAKANARLGAAEVSKRAPDKNNVTEMMLQINP